MGIAVERRAGGRARQVKVAEACREAGSGRELSTVYAVVAVYLVAIVAVSAIVSIGYPMIEQIPPAAIATIGAVTVAAISANGVLRHRCARRGRSNPSWRHPGRRLRTIRHSTTGVAGVIRT